MKRMHLIFLFSFLFVLSISAADKKKDNNRVEITSETLEYKMDELQAVFNRNVKVLRGDMTMHADKMVCHFSKKNELQVIIATGQVRILKGTQKVTAGRAIYRVIDKKITLSKSPVIVDGESIVKARIITMDQTKGTTTFEEPEGSYSASSDKLLKKN